MGPGPKHVALENWYCKFHMLGAATNESIDLVAKATKVSFPILLDLNVDELMQFEPLAIDVVEPTSASDYNLFSDLSPDKQQLDRVLDKILLTEGENKPINTELSNKLSIDIPGVEAEYSQSSSFEGRKNKTLSSSPEEIEKNVLFLN